MNGYVIVRLFQKREIPWEKVPGVPRPSLIPDPITAFGKRPTEKTKRVDKMVITPLDKARIRPKLILTPLKPYVDPREETRERVFSAIRKVDLLPKELPGPDTMDVLLPKLHKAAEVPDLPYKRRIAEAAFYKY